MCAVLYSWARLKLKDGTSVRVFHIVEPLPSASQSVHQQKSEMEWGLESKQVDKECRHGFPLRILFIIHF